MTIRARAKSGDIARFEPITEAQRDGAGYRVLSLTDGLRPREMMRSELAWFHRDCWRYHRSRHPLEFEPTHYLACYEDVGR